MVDKAKKKAQLLNELDRLRQQVLELNATVSRQRQIEEDLRRSEERLKILFEFAPEAYYLNDLKGNFLDGNRAVEELTGYKRDELRGKNFLQLNLLPQGQAARVSALLARNNQGEATGPDEFVLNRRDGAQVTLEIRTFPVKIGDELVVLGSARDVTERKQLEKALHDKEQVYRQAAENSPNPIFSVDRQGTIHMWNRSCEHVFEYGPEIIGCSYHDIMWDNQQWLAVESLLAQVFQERVFSGVEISYRCKSGDRRYMISRLYPFLDGEARIQGCVFANTDITERKTMELELQRLYEQARQDAAIKEELLREINHRVKNNLMAISGLILAEQHYAPVEERAIVGQALERLDWRVRSLAEVHHFLSQTGWSPVPLNDLVQRIIRVTIGAWSPDRHVGVEVEPTNITASPRQASELALVIGELAINSLKHAFPSGSEAPPTLIRVGFALENDLIRLEFRDNGPGYPEAVLSLASQSKLDNGPSPQATFRVGLYLVRGIVASTLRGRLDLSNDHGAVATLWFKTEDNQSPSLLARYGC